MSDDQDHLRDDPSLPGHHDTAHPLDRGNGRCRGCGHDISEYPPPAVLCAACDEEVNPTRSTP